REARPPSISRPLFGANGPGKQAGWDRLLPLRPAWYDIIIAGVPMSSSFPTPWSLHPQLDADSLAIAELPLCRVQLANDANYPWLILVPRRYGATEIIDLDAADRARLMVEIDMAARALRATV